jgi:phospholipase C
VRLLAVALLSVVGLAGSARADAATTFKHIVIVFQENRTPDNLFGSAPHFEPKVDISNTGINSMGQTVPLTPETLASCYDPAHAHSSFETELTVGFDQDPDDLNPPCTLPANPNFKYADNSSGQIQPYFDIATNYGFANRMFQTNQGPSFPAHQFIFGGTSAPSTESPLFASSNLSNQNETAGCVAPPDQRVDLIDGFGSETSNAPIYPCLDHPTLADVLDAKKLSWHYYNSTGTGIWAAPNAIQHICQPAMVGTSLQCEGPDWTNGDVVPNNPAQVITDVQHCRLADVSWVIPTAAESDHSTVTNGTGPAWVATVVDTIGQQAACPNGETYWHDTAIIVTWDDWGGWYDHVPPPLIKVQPSSAPAWGDGYTYGFRIPMMVVSAYTPAGYVDNDVHDFGTILYFIESNFHLGFIGPGDTIYSKYADYQAAARGDSLEKFFSLKTARAFVSIPTALGPSYFLHQPISLVPPDND